MIGIADTLRTAAALLRRGRLTQEEAQEAIARGDGWIEGLGPRRTSRAFADEYAEVVAELGALQAEYTRRFRKRVLALCVPQRLSRKYSALPMDQAMANLAALNDPRAKERDPGLFKAQRAVMCSAEVEFVGNAWTQHPRVSYRARVRDLWVLIINGKRVLEGSRALCMRQADWALMCDPLGKLPEIETLTGLAKRRALYKARKARRPPKKMKAGVRWRVGNRQRLIIALGNKMASHLWKYMMRPSAFSQLLLKRGMPDDGAHR